MSTVKFNEKNLFPWVDALMKKQKVIGVQAKESQFVFEPLIEAKALRLDYDVTVLPIKKFFFPERETLLQYTKRGEYQAELESEPFVLFGVHPYDVVALAQMDRVFSQGKPDPYYLAKRNQATIVACDVQTPSPHVFAASMNTATVHEGFDLLLTKIGEDYVAETKSDKGEALLQDLPGKDSATEVDLEQREAVWGENRKALARHKLNFDPSELPELLGKSYHSSLWERKSERCFSCGSCNLVCPTCYCFDVHDEVNWDLQSGKRVRSWDACLLKNFAEVAGGHNFREQKAERYRHRYYRKGKYMPEKYGQIACVGCGRCISACVPQIANPVEVYNELYEEQGK